MESNTAEKPTTRLSITGQQAPNDRPKIHPSRSANAVSACEPTAVVYCEANFGRIDGKTANGLIRYSQAYRILSVIDSTCAGRDSGQVLDNVDNGVPILNDIAAAVTREARIPDTLIYGMAPSTGKLSPSDRKVLLDAIARGMSIVSGLHEYLSDDPVFEAAAKAANVTIRDIRKPLPSKDMRLFDGSISTVKAIRIAVLGTDCAIGKRTTATILARALNARGIKTVLVGTGQTGLMQGAKYGIAMDAVPPQFCCGELERVIVAASHGDEPDVILIEGQGALSHPAFCTSAFILRGSQPHAVILQHAPKRAYRCDFPTMPMPEPKSEIALIEAFADTRVIGVTLNHAAMTDAEVGGEIETLSRDLGIPVTDALTRPDVYLTDMVLATFPQLRPVPLVAAE
ncbi:DUF1611 domain-containing protein [Parasedimentitalea maritima]|uniref:DUF1611 domain-containing protein n=1 Tax=Parasedimentitalea maritima TaxID=2578117 RepID=A0ABY2UPK5_9RHOB|nr:DUF1611 domain-containing protein [Zongyanglinia marina]TLP55545.1 DUF1611 domain-containing protein [Zongyanglinia marina]